MTVLTGRESLHPGTRIPVQVRAVVFDMDGVLLDTEELWHRAEARLCAAHGTVFRPADETATLGVLAIEACRWYARRFGLPDEAAPALETELHAYMTDELESTVPTLPGAVELIERLRGLVGLAVASNSRRIIVERAVERAGVRDAFAVIVSADDVARPKPAPDLYLLACERLGVSPTDALALEDSSVGATAALAAGMACYVVRREPPPGMPEVTGWLPALTELLATAD